MLFIPCKMDSFMLEIFYTISMYMVKYTHVYSSCNYLKPLEERNVKRIFNGKEVLMDDNPIASWLFSNSASAPIWLIFRIYLGVTWLRAGISKVTNEMWVGAESGTALTGFISATLEKASIDEVPSWYALFSEKVVLPNATFFSFIVAWGEVFVGVGLIIGMLTGIAAFFGAFMNISFLLAGAVSINPFMFIVSILLILGWKVAGHYGVDQYLLPKLGTPWALINPSNDDGRLDSLKYFHYVD